MGPRDCSLATPDAAEVTVCFDAKNGQGRSPLKAPQDYMAAQGRHSPERIFAFSILCDLSRTLGRAKSLVGRVWAHSAKETCHQFYGVNVTICIC